MATKAGSVTSWKPGAAPQGVSGLSAPEAHGHSHVAATASSAYTWLADSPWASLASWGPVHPARGRVWPGGALERSLVRLGRSLQTRAWLSAPNGSREPSTEGNLELGALASITPRPAKSSQLGTTVGKRPSPSSLSSTWRTSGV